MTLKDALAARYSDATEFIDQWDAAPEQLAHMASRGSVRHFKPDAVSPSLLKILSAVALSAPTKSDLQQRDIVIVTDPTVREKLNQACASQDWLSSAPALLIVLGNHRRQQRINKRQGHVFANNHFDALFNAAVDGGVTLSAMVTAAESIGLGCCPVSAIRNEPENVARILHLPELVFPVAALAIGWPARQPEISPRLPLTATIHENCFTDTNEDTLAAQYDRSRSYSSQRSENELGHLSEYGWSEDKARQYSKPERASFGGWLKKIGFHGLGE